MHNLAKKTYTTIGMDKQAVEVLQKLKKTTGLSVKKLASILVLGATGNKLNEFEKSIYTKITEGV